MIALERLKLERDHVDEYVRKFRALAREAGYDVRERNIKRLFILGLPIGVAREVKRAPAPDTFEEHVAKLIQVVKDDYDITEMFKQKLATSNPRPNNPGSRGNWRNQPDNIQNRATAPSTTPPTPPEATTTRLSPWTPIEPGWTAEEPEDERPKCRPAPRAPASSAEGSTISEIAPSCNAPESEQPPPHTMKMGGVSKKNQTDHRRARS